MAGSTAIHLIPESRGPSRVLTQADREGGEVYQNAVQVDDAAGIVLYSSWGQTSSAGARIAIASLSTGETTILDVLGTHPLLGLPFDVATRRAAGEPRQLVNDVMVNSTSGLARAALSPTGTLFYQSGGQVSQVVLAGARGAGRTLLDQAKEYGFRASPRMPADWPSPRRSPAAGTSGSTT